LSTADLLRGILQKLAYTGAERLSSDTPASVLEIDVDGKRFALVALPKEACHLSPRETEIVRLVADGLPNKCISAVLQISTFTVATHLRRIFAKLHVGSRAAMVARLMDVASRQSLGPGRQPPPSQRV
jgi:DNA-binding CsgD family transcriptional regulator